MPTIRAPAVAGTFYPDDRDLLEEMVAGFLAAHRSDEPAPKAIIVPHAGYVYSGPIAASAYARIDDDRRLSGRPIYPAAAPLAALAVSRGASLATRNVATFVGCGVDVVDPWNEGS